MFAGELRILADKNYPNWEPTQCLEMAKNEFVQEIRSPTTQLALTCMKEKPSLFEKAMELAQAQEAAQKRLQRKQAAALSSTVGDPTEKPDETDALYGPTTCMQQPSDQPQDLTRQVRQLTDAATCLSAHSGDHDVGHTQRSKQQRGRGPPVCWGCRESGHLRRKCPHRRTGQEQPRVSDSRCAKGTFSLATDTALSTSGWI